jgi:uncharacterized membrane protein YbhN (UPF0104 family)
MKTRWFIISFFVLSIAGLLVPNWRWTIVGLVASAVLLALYFWVAISDWKTRRTRKP